jgi:TonB family protein
MMTKGIVLPALMALAVVAFAKPKAEEIPAIENENALPADNNTTNNPEDALTRIPNEGEDLSVNKPMETPSIPVTEKADDNKVYDKVDELASFPGGTVACYRWLSDHIKYPEECKEKGIEGEVTVLFVVEKDGSISDIKAQHSTDEAFVKEVTRVVSSMPKWKPAKVNGEVVRSRMHFPINFGFTDKEKKMVYFKIGKGSLSQEITSVTGQGTPSGEVTDDNIYSDPETNASFPGGMEALYKWISENLRYPEECKANNIQGRVIVQFVIDTDGSITEIKAIRSPDDVLSQEAIRVLSAMPKWKPATSDGKNPVRSLFRLPMNFRLPPAQTEQNPNN